MQLALKAGELKTWWSPSELAELNLPGLSPARNRLVEIATKYGWQDRYDVNIGHLARQRAGRGGGFEYHYSVLPAVAALEMVKRGLLTASQAQLNVGLSEGSDPSGETSSPPPHEMGEEKDKVGSWAWYDAQPDKTKAVAKARLEVLQAVEQAETALGGRNVAVFHIAKGHGIGKATIWTWIDLVKGAARTDWLPALAPKYAKTGGKKADIDERVFQYFKSLYLTPLNRTYAGAFYFTKRWAESEGLTMPKLKTLQRRLEAEVPREAIILARQGMKALLETVPSQTRTVAGLHAMSCVNIDGHTIDVFVTPPGEPDAKPIRATLIGMQDSYARKMLAWRLCGEESVFHTRLCFADLFAKWGLPERVYMDNGRAFASKYLTGGTKTRFRYVVRENDPLGLLPALGIPNTFATPEHGQAKPIERSFGDLVKFIAKHPMCEGAYTGNRTDRKPHDYGKKALKWEELSALVDEMIPEYNAYQGRRSEMALLGGGDRSFDDVFNESRAESVIRHATREQIAMALLEAKTHRADPKTGEIRILGNRHHNEGLYPFAGQDVTVRFDPDNLHRPIHVYQVTGEFICEAEAIEKSGYLDTEAAKQIGKKRAEMRRLGRQLIEAEGLLAASEMAAMQPKAEPAEDAPRPAAVRLVRSRGNSATARQVILDGAPKVDREPFRDRFTAAVASLQAEPEERRFKVYDGGLSPQQEPERP